MILTLFVLLIYLLILVYNAKFIKMTCDNDSFMSVEYSTVFKGLCCIIIIFVHIPSTYSNVLQDLVGSFAYICVTIFFLLSSYGIQWSVKNKRGYLKHFVRNRLVSLLIPFSITLFLRVSFGFELYLGGLRFVYCLIIFYAVFYVSYRFFPRAANIIICVLVLIYSIAGTKFEIGVGWYVESMGFIYGVVLADNMEKIKSIFRCKFMYKMLVMASLILALSYLVFKNVPFWGDYILRLALGLIMTATVLCITYRVKIGNKISRFLGQISYEVFLIHGFVISAVLYLNDEILEIEISSDIFVFLIITGSVICASLMHKLDSYLISKLVYKY